jgi:hypothetical protein
MYKTKYRENDIMSNDKLWEVNLETGTSVV